jgi:hypothetical protein
MTKLRTSVVCKVTVTPFNSDQTEQQREKEEIQVQVISPTRDKVCTSNIDQMETKRSFDSLRFGIAIGPLRPALCSHCLFFVSFFFFCCCCCDSNCHPAAADEIAIGFSRCCVAIDTLFCCSIRRGFVSGVPDLVAVAVAVVVELATPPTAAAAAAADVETLGAHHDGLIHELGPRRDDSRPERTRYTFFLWCPSLFSFLFFKPAPTAPAAALRSMFVGCWLGGEDERKEQGWKVLGSLLARR